MKEYGEPRAVQLVAATELPTRWGVFRALGFELQIQGRRPTETAIALVLGEPTGRVPLVRIHSQCITGDVLRSLRCDCGEQLELAMRAIATEGRGLLIYEQQEGRGIGLMAKLQAYALQGVLTPSRQTMRLVLKQTTGTSACPLLSSLISESDVFSCFPTILKSAML